MTYTDEGLYASEEYTTGNYSAEPGHVPSTVDVRSTYATDYYMVTVGSRDTPTGRAEAFDRWLAGVKADAWDEGWDAGPVETGEPFPAIQWRRPDNPYRQA